MGPPKETEALLNKTPPELRRRCHEDDILDSTQQRHVHLDLTRVICVVLVMIDHGDMAFGQKNVLFSQSWVLQLLFVISGICWTLSSRSLGAYLWRLALYFSVGVGANSLAQVLHGKLNRNIFNVVFQMWFVFGLGMFIVLTTPLKLVLQRSRAEADERQASEEEQPEAPPELVYDEAWEDHLTSDSFDALYQAMALFGPIPLLQLVLHAIHAWSRRLLVESLGSTDLKDEAKEAMGMGASYWLSDLDHSDAIGQLGISLGAMWIVFVGARLFETPNWLPWCLIGYIYFARIFVVPALYGQCKVERCFAALEWFLIGMTASYTGMKNRVWIRRWIGRYWFVAIFVLALIWDPTWFVRFDEHPPRDRIVLLRVKVSEACAIIVFLACGDQLFDPRIFTEDRMMWVCDWALLMFLVHQAVHIIVPSPVNWIVIVFSLPLTWWVRSSYDVKKKRRQQAPPTS